MSYRDDIAAFERALRIDRRDVSGWLATAQLRADEGIPLWVRMCPCAVVCLPGVTLAWLTA